MINLTELEKMCAEAAENWSDETFDIAIMTSERRFAEQSRTALPELIRLLKDSREIIETLIEYHEWEAPAGYATRAKKFLEEVER